MLKPKLLLPLLAALAAGLLIFYPRSDGRDEDNGTDPIAASNADQGPNNDNGSAPLAANRLPAGGSGRAVTTAAPRPTREAPSERTFGLPDGTRLPVLNGAYGAPDIQWPAGIPWSPVVRKMVDNDGQEWYVHADGTYSSTVITYRSDLGRHVPVTQVAHPEKAAPMDPSEAPKGPGTQGKKQ